jgi:hypothetical protein
MCEATVNCHFFAGPTLYGGASREVTETGLIKWHPPVRRGDIDRLIAEEATGRVAIVDGVFHQCLSVGHAEILRAIDRGWEVWGLSSMGAIRAYEMRDFGMKGFGQVFEMFVKEDDFKDDEVALLHAPEPPYQAFSEPLVHIRVALKDLIRRGLIQEEGSSDVIDKLAAVWFGDRTLGLTRELVLAAVSPECSATVDQWINDFSRYRVKSHDLKKFLGLLPLSERA